MNGQIYNFNWIIKNKNKSRVFFYNLVNKKNIINVLNFF